MKIPDLYGCSDHNCLFGHKGGMGTNGGCSCEKDLHRLGPLGLKAARQIRLLRKRIAELGPIVEDAEQCGPLMDAAANEIELLRKRISELGAENERLAARTKELGAKLNWWQDAGPIIEDAERYRWGLRHPSMMANHFIKWRSNADHYNCRNTGRHPNEAIDEAIKREGDTDERRS